MRLARLLATWSEARRLVGEREARERAAAARFAVALAFNRIWTFRPSRPDCRWMCPSCNRVHAATSDWSAFTGLQYPACCSAPAGPRLDSAHATDGAYGKGSG